MESENGVALEDEKCVVIEGKQVEESIVDSDKDRKNIDLGMNGSAEPAKVNNGLDSSSDAVKASVKNAKIPKNSVSTTNKVDSKNSANVTKDNTALKSTNPTSRNARAALTQSLSFPARESRGDVMKRSVDAAAVVKRVPRENGAKPEPSFANGTLASAASNRPNRRASVAVPVQSKAENKINARRATLSSIPSNKQPVVSKKLGVLSEAVNGSSDETSLPVEKDSVLDKSSTKEEDDSHSTASTGTPHSRKSNALGFASRLEERAAKRKEFFTKLEENTQAKEVEKTNLQEKSKESQDAEIKQLRKSMTFKASPMPNFYREPLPKVELKKIPTTRAISPKLGRNKNSNSESNNSSGVVVASSPRVNQKQTEPRKGFEKDLADSNKAVSVKKSQPKQAKLVKSKAKPERQNQKEDFPNETEQSHDNQQRDHVSEPNEETIAHEVIPHAHEIIPQEVAVGV